MLYFRGELAGKKLGEYQGQKRCHLQFIDKKSDGSLGFLEIKVPDGLDHTKWNVGQKVELPIEIKLVRDRLYYNVSQERAGAAETPQRP